MRVDKQTAISRDKKKVDATELKAGQSLVVDAYGDSLEDRDLLAVGIPHRSADCGALKGHLQGPGRRGEPLGDVSEHNGGLSTMVMTISKRQVMLFGMVLALVLVGPGWASAHGVSARNALFVQAIDGPAVGPFLYLGAKHMVTGYDHLLFLIGVIFFLYRLKDIVQYVSLFTSATV